ncbi:unnamed protein product [Darwinula stevensoni]|uniref:Uncharacterized protein n=1 Tax=Darwinula stevensoni TaxID=69355 RepID=A0A7R9ADR5_9CRUS|nr:unnamed protein product [Darwinula stevensoni]CAG0901565.1 unnamed protein product [Darwinula stevensoni]
MESAWLEVFVDVPEGHNRCREDDQVICEDNATWICNVQKCDGIPDCPGGDDEFGCPTRDTQFTGATFDATATELKPYRFELLVNQQYTVSLSDQESSEFRRLADEMESSLQDLLFSLPGKAICTLRRIENVVDVSSKDYCRATIDILTGADKESLRRSIRRISSAGVVGRYNVKEERTGLNLRDIQVSLISCGNDFVCDTGECVSSKLRCNDAADCIDGSDEFGCSIPGCSEDEFQCNTGDCILTKFKCDSYDDCPDGSDERGCPCLEDQFACKDGMCIDERRRCDRVVDCPDGSDELGCPGCREEEFTCNDKTCIDAKGRCDAVLNCPDLSDEIGCPCREDEFACRDGTCIDESKQCDWTRDCLDASDEADCPLMACGAGNFRCTDGTCIDSSLRCNGNRDCVEGSDEIDCYCREGEFECEDGMCIDGRLRCDRNRDCLDGSDEILCPVSLSSRKSSALPTLARPSHARPEFDRGVKLRRFSGGVRGTRAADLSRRLNFVASSLSWISGVPSPPVGS